MTECPLATSGKHDIEWMTVPAMYWNGELSAPEHERGFCWTCDERFTR